MTPQLIAQASLTGVLTFSILALIAARNVNTTRERAYRHPHNRQAVQAYARALRIGLVPLFLALACVVAFAASVAYLTLT